MLQKMENVPEQRLEMCIIYLHFIIIISLYTVYKHIIAHDMDTELLSSLLSDFGKDTILI